MRSALGLMVVVAACGDNAGPEVVPRRLDAICAAQDEYALCVCGRFFDVGTLDVRGSLAVNGASAPHAPVMVARNWLAYGGLSTVADVVVGRDLWTAGDAHLAGRTVVSRDFGVGGSLFGDGDLDVAGTMRVGGIEAHSGHEDVGVVGAATKAPPPACPCTLDVAHEVALASGELPVELADGDTVFDDGDHYVLAPTTMAGKRLVVRGDATLYVDGMLDALGPEQLAVDPGARVDVWVSTGIVRLHPIPGVRIFVGGEEPMLLYGGEISLYAPTVPVWYATEADLDGALIVESLHGVGPLQVTQQTPEACTAGSR